MPRTILSATLLLSAVCLQILWAQEKPPTADEIKQALEHARKVRVQTEIVPDAARIKVGAVLKIDDVRCGFAIVRIEDNHGGSGATYKLTERLKVGAPHGLDFEVTDYTGTLLLDKDLALISGAQKTERTVTFGKDTETEVVSAELTLVGDQLAWTRSEKRGNDQPVITKPDPVKLNGVRPIPRNAVLALAVMAAKEPNFKPGIFSPLCAPTMDLGWTIDAFMIQPVWLTFTPPDKNSAPGTSLVMRMRYFEGEIPEKAAAQAPDAPTLIVVPPSNEQFDDVLVWQFDSAMHVVSQPESGSQDMKAENVDADQLDVNEPLNQARIREAMDAAEQRARKKDEPKITKIPLK